jgi:hypothetical protein
MGVEVGTYSDPNAVGYLGWIKTDRSCVFINIDGTLTDAYPID